MKILPQGFVGYIRCVDELDRRRMERKQLLRFAKAMTNLGAQLRRNFDESILNYLKSKSVL